MDVALFFVSVLLSFFFKVTCALDRILRHEAERTDIEVSDEAREAHRSQRGELVFWKIFFLILFLVVGAASIASPVAVLFSRWL